MRLVIQRVSRASVSVHQQTIASIGAGLLVLVGFEETDGPEDIQWASGKLVRLRIFNDAAGVMNLSAAEVDAGILIVSQFTLYASIRKGNRPSYQGAAVPAIAIPLYEQFLRQVEQDLGRGIECGEFGADMQVALVNDGPVTLLIDTKERE